MSDETTATEAMTPIDPGIQRCEPAYRLQAELDQIAREFAHHPPSSPAIGDLHTACRSQCRGVAEWMLANLPWCEERGEAIKHLRLAMMWGNAAIACHQPQAAP